MNNYKTLIDGIKRKYSYFLKGFKKIILLKKSELKDETSYCFIIKKGGLEFLERRNKKISTTTLNYETGIVHKDKQLIKGGVDLLMTILKRVNRDVFNKKIRFFMRKNK
jgi:hypothetical protein